MGSFKSRLASLEAFAQIGLHTYFRCTIVVESPFRPAQDYANRQYIEGYAWAKAPRNTLFSGATVGDPFSKAHFETLKTIMPVLLNESWIELLPGPPICRTVPSVIEAAAGRMMTKVSTLADLIAANGGKCASIEVGLGTIMTIATNASIFGALLIKGVVRCEATVDGFHLQVGTVVVDGGSDDDETSGLFECDVRGSTDTQVKITLLKDDELMDLGKPIEIMSKPITVQNNGTVRLTGDVVQTPQAFILSGYKGQINTYRPIPQIPANTSAKTVTEQRMMDSTAEWTSRLPCSFNDCDCGSEELFAKIVEITRSGSCTCRCKSHHSPKSSSSVNHSTIAIICSVLGVFFTVGIFALANRGKQAKTVAKRLVSHHTRTYDHLIHQHNATAESSLRIGRLKSQLKIGLKQVGNVQSYRQEIPSPGCHNTGLDETPAWDYSLSVPSPQTEGDLRSRPRQPSNQMGNRECNYEAAMTLSTPKMAIAGHRDSVVSRSEFVGSLSYESGRSSLHAPSYQVYAPSYHEISYENSDSTSRSSACERSSSQKYQAKAAPVVYDTAKSSADCPSDVSSGATAGPSSLLTLVRVLQEDPFSFETLQRQRHCHKMALSLNKNITVPFGTAAIQSSRERFNLFEERQSQSSDA
jgi:hypothetical protein